MLLNPGKKIMGGGDFYYTSASQILGPYGDQNQFYSHFKTRFKPFCVIQSIIFIWCFAKFYKSTTWDKSNLFLPDPPPPPSHQSMYLYHVQKVHKSINDNKNILKSDSIVSDDVEAAMITIWMRSNWWYLEAQDLNCWICWLNSLR